MRPNRRLLCLGLPVAALMAATIAIGYAGAGTEPRESAKSQDNYAAEGPFQVSTRIDTWRDFARSRDVPVQIYAPVVDEKSTQKGLYPLILFSHGLGGNREGGKLWAMHWASHGYVVIALQHPGSDEALWRDRAGRDVESSLKAGMTITNLGLRVGDVHFAIGDAIRRQTAGEPGLVLADTQRIGMSGHSFGAQTTLAVSGQKFGTLAGQSGLDLRITAAVAFSPNARNKKNVERQFGDIRIPFFSVTGTRDSSILDAGTRYQDRMMPYENMPAGGKYLAVFDEGDHMVFGGHALGGRRSETDRDREIQKAVEAATLAFWNTTLKGDMRAKSWLDEGGLKSSLQEKDVFLYK